MPAFTRPVWTKDWFESDEDVEDIEARIDQLAEARYPDSELRTLWSHDMPDIHIFVLLIPGSDPDLVHWFQFRQTAIGEPYR